jgi:hypothetical protein
LFFVDCLVAQGRTIAKTVEIAHDLAKKIIEACGGTSAANRDKVAP